MEVPPHSNGQRQKVGGRVRRAARVDANHAEIVRALRSVGCSVLDLSRVGSGCPDLLVGWKGRQMVLMEVKVDKGELNAEQVTFADAWRGIEPVVVRSVKEALDVVQPQKR
jgi:Holliday junction resolvase